MQFCTANDHSCYWWWRQSASMAVWYTKSRNTGRFAMVTVILAKELGIWNSNNWAVYSSPRLEFAKIKIQGFLLYGSIGSQMELALGKFKFNFKKMIAFEPTFRKCCHQENSPRHGKLTQWRSKWKKNRIFQRPKPWALGNLYYQPTGPSIDESSWSTAGIEPGPGTLLRRYALTTWKLQSLCSKWR